MTLAGRFPRMRAMTQGVVLFKRNEVSFRFKGDSIDQGKSPVEVIILFSIKDDELLTECEDGDNDRKVEESWCEEIDDLRKRVKRSAQRLYVS